MEKRALLLIGVASMTLTMSAAQKQQPIAPIQEVSFTQVHLNDGFWSPRIEINRTVSIPSAFHEPTEKVTLFEAGLHILTLRSGRDT